MTLVPIRNLIRSRPHRRSARAQALVETAIIIPVVLILLLGALDFGRAFFGWASLHQAVRNGANFAAMNPDMTTVERTRFEELIVHDIGGSQNCELDSPIPNPTYTDPGGAVTADPQLGDNANLTLQCDFTPITPLIGGLIGDPLEMRASSTFPIREGCTNCPTPVPATPPPPGAQCFEVPEMQGMSVEGARLAWASAGFDPAKFTPATGDDTETVDTVAVTQDDPLSTCVLPSFAIFSSSVTVTTEDPVDPCALATVPNLTGMTLGQAQTEWTNAGFTGTFTADGGDPTVPAQDRVVTAQVTDPPSTAGVDCVDPATMTVDVTTGDAWADPPATPCRVPNMINLSRDDGQAAWVTAGFQSINFEPQQGGFTIRSQTLVGGGYVTCEASIEVSASP